MDSAPQILTLVLGSSVVGGIVTKLLDMWKDRRAGAIAQRRAEVDTALAAKAKAELALEEKEADADYWARWARIVEEHAAVLRMIIINKIGAETLPPYPIRPKE